MANSGKSYEELTRKIFAAFLNQDRVKTIEVRHDVILQGKSTSHQIDVYWEFELQAGMRYATVVQCKDWSNPVEQGELLKFKAVLDDLRGQPRGVFVTRTGYQSGAREYADAHGIKLYELRQPAPTDSGMRRIVLEINFFSPTIHQWSLILDREWARQEKIRMRLDPDRKVDVDFNWKGTDALEDAAGEGVQTVNQLLNKMVGPQTTDMGLTQLHHDFVEPTFISVNNEFFTRLKVLALDATASGKMHHSEIVFDNSDMVEFVLKDVLADEHHYFAASGPKQMPQ